MGFTGHIFFIPAQKFTMRDEDLKKDKSPYNDKETEDMLRHFKLEYFLMTNALAFIITEAILMSRQVYDLKCRGLITESTKFTLVCCMLPRIARYIYYSISLIKGNKWFE